ncbi:methyltransferase domain-containing protein [Kaistella jeonii]|uniref:methyltransferase domain-containing protein n=1 Tax=Kaistella jeonii TaxID=266749 RepID=UPI001FE43944|nr:methyltransferase domain-containing protein [Kaistella jeonii]
MAELNPNCEIECYDFSDELLKKAKEISDEKNLKNISFHAENIMEYHFDSKKYDVVFFHASLHHFDHIPEFLQKVVIKNLVPNGLLIINEFVGSNWLQYSKLQLKYINKAISIIPKEYRKIFKTNIYKNNYYGSGILRMIIADPSECVDSISILPAIHEKFNTIEEKFYGNNILQSALKDISHHFVELNPEKKKVLHQIFDMEDELLEKHPSDFVFGIYEMKT